MKAKHPWLYWLSGFFAAVGVVHLLPLVVRHDLSIGGALLTTEATAITTVVALVLSLVVWKLADRGSSTVRAAPHAG